MGLNNKGFAISTVIYGLLMMAVLVMVILISTMSFNNKTTKDLVTQLETELNACSDNGSC